MNTAKKHLLAGAGFVCLGLGAAGIFIPVLPTTPFVLLAAACFLRSSEKMYVRLVRHPLFGEHLKNYYEYHAIKPRAKIVALLALWTGIGVTAIFIVSAWWLRLLLLAVAVAVSIHVLCLRTLRRAATVTPPKGTGDDD